MVNSTLTLVIQKGPKRGETIECSSGREIRIGRIVRGNTFTIKDPSISQKHLTISAGTDGSWRVSDLDTSNGTFVNDSQIVPFAPTVIRDGDVLKIGTDTSILVRISVSAGVQEAVMEEVEEEKKKVEVKTNTRRYATRRAGVPGSATAAVEEIDDISKNKVARTGRVRRPPRKAANIVVATSKELLEIEKLKVDNGAQEYVAAEEKCESVLVEENAMEVDGISKTKFAKSGRVRRLPTKAAEIIVGAPEELLEIEELKIDSGDQEYAATKEKCVEKDVLLEENAQKVDKSDRDMGAASTSGSKFGPLTDEEMETMTLGEWFDRMEKYMPMVIDDIAEEIIAELREKARRFNELIPASSNDMNGKS